MNDEAAKNESEIFYGQVHLSNWWNGKGNAVTECFLIEREHIFFKVLLCEPLMQFLDNTAWLHTEALLLLLLLLLLP